jgi:hypothetical protein
MTAKDRIGELEARVVNIEQILSKLLSGGARVPQEVAGDSFEIVSFDVKNVSQPDMLTTFAYKLQVRNLTNQKLTLSGYILFLDSEGYELEKSVVSMFEVPPAQLHQTSGQARLLGVGNLGRLADIKANIQVM